jgi:two-component system, chemotaxis family, protein-glutamate methylesterase/glutaminase
VIVVAPVRVLVVDDSLLYRKIVRDTLATIPEVEVVGSATNGKMAIEKISELRPDLVTLDFEMPELDGLGVLKWLRQQRVATKAVMLSAVTLEGADATMRALQEGAFDFVVKPAGDDAQSNRVKLQEALQERVQTVRYLLERGLAAKSIPAAPVARRPVAAPLPTSPAALRPITPRPATAPRNTVIKAIGIGVSTGGPDALRVMLPKVVSDLNVPIFLVQHMPPVFTKSLANSLDKMCQVRVHEASDNQLALPNNLYIAPGGRQMKVIATPQGTVIRLTDDPPIQSCRPSVDYLFDSLANTYGGNTLSVIMTGMGYDGAEGCKKLHDLGGPVIAQDEASCVVFGMPRKPVQEGYADIVSPLTDIATHIERLVKRGGAA